VPGVVAPLPDACWLAYPLDGRTDKMEVMDSSDAGGVSVLIVDDQRPFRMAAGAVVKVTPGFRVVGEASSGEEAVKVVPSLKPDLVLMDINMEAMNGIEATRKIVTELPDVAVVLLSTYDEADLPGDARTCGAIAYVHKERFGPDELERIWNGRDKPTAQAVSD
jgi:two-component system, NarL family, invasion response regulator UvrY